MNMLQTPDAQTELSPNHWAVRVPWLRTSRLAAGLKILLGTVVALFASMAEPLLAQPSAAPSSTTQENRYLLIVDTSKALRERALGSLNSVAVLLASGMDGQIRDGDTLALWTFDDQLYAGRFPIQRWSATEQGTIITRVLSFLRDQPVGKLSKIDNVFLAMGYVVQASQCATVILVTDGEHKIHGTPFDDQINNACAKLEKKQRKAKMPFVITLRALKGNITDFVVSTPPGPIQIPPVPAPVAPVPIPVQVAKEPRVPAIDIKKLPPGAMVFAGSSAKPIVGPNPPEPPPVKVEAPAKSETPAPAAVANMSVQLPATLNAPAIVAPSIMLSDTAGTLNDKPASPVPSAPNLAKMEKAEPAPVTNASETNAIALAAPLVGPPAPAIPFDPQPILSAVPKAEPAKAPESKPVALSEPLPVVAVAVPPSSLPAPKPVQSEVAKSVSKTEVKTTSVLAAPSAPIAAPVAAAASAHAGELLPVKAHPHIHPPHPQVAMAPPADHLMSHWTFWAAALFLAATAVSCSIVVARRSRVAPSGSLITCSFDRNK